MMPPPAPQLGESAPSVPASISPPVGAGIGADLTHPDPPPVRDSISQACARALNAPVLVTDIGDGALLVEPLHFHRVVHRQGRKVVAKLFHDAGDTDA